jgi:hypothetical protein
VGNFIPESGAKEKGPAAIMRRAILKRELAETFIPVLGGLETDHCFLTWKA